MNIVLLSGGSGKRLWPLSNDVRSKQFIKIFKRADGSYESMVQRMYRGIKTIDPNAEVTIATSKAQVSAIHNQIGEKVGISVEPMRRDTFPAIALACVYLHEVRGAALNEAVVVCPVDPFVEDDYFEMLRKLGQQAEKGTANLVLMGVEPKYASEKYGYIIPLDRSIVSEVDSFKEKPDIPTAEKYISAGALWNGGVFAFKLGYVINRAHELIDFESYQDLFDKYASLTKISFDYAVVEKEPKIEVLRFSGTWEDIGMWGTLTDVMAEDTVGNAVLERSSNTKVINELDVPVVCLGLSNVVVAASPEGILVSDKEASSDIKPIVDAIGQQARYVEKSWGKYQVIDAGETSLAIKITLFPGHRMHYHSHEQRDETWTIVSGEGVAVIDDSVIPVRPGSMLQLPVGSRHSLIAKTELIAIEVQIGEEIRVSDKKKYGLAEKYGEKL